MPVPQLNLINFLIRRLFEYTLTSTYQRMPGIMEIKKGIVICAKDSKNNNISHISRHASETFERRDKFSLHLIFLAFFRLGNVL